MSPSFVQSYFTCKNLATIFMAYSTASNTKFFFYIISNCCSGINTNKKLIILSKPMFEVLPINIHASKADLKWRMISDYCTISVGSPFQQAAMIRKSVMASVRVSLAFKDKDKTLLDYLH